MERCEERVIVLEPSAHADVIVERDAPPQHKSARIVAASGTLVYVRSGVGRYRSARRESRIGPGTLIVMPPGYAEFEVDDVHDTIVIPFREPARTGTGIDDLIPAVERQLDPDEARWWEARFDVAAARVEAGRFDADDLRGLFRTLRPLAWRPVSAPAESALRGAFAELRARFTENVRLDELARLVGYAPNHLNDIARSATGRSLGAWLTEMRMAQARALLADGDLAIADVGARSGYADPAYFARAFRRVHGVAPATWRVAARPDDARHARVALPYAALKRGGLPPELLVAVA